MGIFAEALLLRLIAPVGTLVRFRLGAAAMGTGDGDENGDGAGDGGAGAASSVLMSMPNSVATPARPLEKPWPTARSFHCLLREYTSHRIKAVSLPCGAGVKLTSDPP